MARMRVAVMRNVIRETVKRFGFSGSESSVWGRV